jgi:predicted Zn-dependent protease
MRLGGKLHAALPWLVAFSVSWPGAHAFAATAAGVSHTAKWHQEAITIHVDDSMLYLDIGIYDVVVAAVSEWQNAFDQLPTLVVEKTRKGTIGYHPGGANHNTLRFDVEGAPIAKGALAVTLVTSDERTGRIVDADIVINGEHSFAKLEDVKDPAKHYDVQNLVTHELGHLLGLPEETIDREATMYLTSAPGETHKRDLSRTDREAVETLYIADAAGSLEGCGGATVSRSNPTQWGAWTLLLGSGLILRRGSRRAKGQLSLTIAAIAMLGMPPEEAPAVSWSTVVAVESEWRDGVIWSELALQPDNCAACPTVKRWVPGGVVGHIRQQVGALQPAEAGDRMSTAAR